MPDRARSGEQAAATGAAGPAINEMLLRVLPQPARPAIDNPAVPPGAQFRNGAFQCHAGRRAYRTYVPASASHGVTGIVVMLHGCTQSPEDFAAGTGMNVLAEQHRFVVIYPHQSRGSNAQSCWNWFSPGDQRRGHGEPAIIAGLTRKAMADHGVSKDRTFVAGLSAGAAMAVILGVTYPDVFAGVGAHSGLPFGAANTLATAFEAMAGRAAPEDAVRAPAVRTIVFHGTADTIVHPANGERIARHAADGGSRQTIEYRSSGTRSGRSFSTEITQGPDGMPEMEHWVVDGLGHAWSGGSPAGSYTDPGGPDASAEMIRFFFDSTGRAV